MGPLYFGQLFGDCGSCSCYLCPHLGNYVLDVEKEVEKMNEDLKAFRVKEGK